MLSGILNVPVFWLIGETSQFQDGDDIDELNETLDLKRRLQALIKIHGETAQLLFDMQSELQRLQNKIDKSNESM